MQNEPISPPACVSGTWLSAGFTTLVRTWPSSSPDFCLWQPWGNENTLREKDVDCDSPAVFSQHLPARLALRRDLKAGGLIILEGISFYFSYYAAVFPSFFLLISLFLSLFWPQRALFPGFWCPPLASSKVWQSFQESLCHSLLNLQPDVGSFRVCGGGQPGKITSAERR